MGYISYDRSIEFIDKCLEHEELLQSVERETLIAVKKYLESIPAADVRPVVRGKWVESFPLEVECSCCKFRIKSLLKIWYKFCPNCGADMRQEPT